MNKEKIMRVAFSMFMTAVGGVAGICIVKYVKINGESLPRLFYAMLCIPLAFFLSIIIHEGGHLVMGIKTGYTFLSFRVGSLTLVKQDGKFRLKKYNITGTGGQCLLMPPPCDEPKQAPFLMYHLGGGLFNLATAAIFLPLGLWSASFYLKLLFVIIGTVSAYTGVTNLLPIKMQIATDGYNILNMLRHPKERESIFKVLRINGLMHEGASPAEIPAELFELGGEKGGTYEGAEKLLKASVCFDKREFADAQKLLEECLEVPKLIFVYRMEAKCELLFCRIVNNASKEEIEKLYDKELKSYIRSSGKTQISKKRLLYAYELLYKKNEAMAKKEYMSVMKMKDTYPNAGELKSELSLMQYLQGLQKTTQQDVYEPVMS